MLAGGSPTVPPAQSLLSGRLFHQFFVLDATANPLGMTVTNGGAAVIGH